MVPTIRRCLRTLATGLAFSPVLFAAAQADEPLPPPPAQSEKIAALLGLPTADKLAEDSAKSLPTLQSQPLASIPGDCEPVASKPRKLPANVQPLPRLGWFNIPPNRPGYYTLFDVICQRPREAPPKMPYPPIAPAPGSFFDADYRYLDDSNYADRDWADRFKRRPLGDNWMLSVGGEFRYRLMDEIGSRLTATNNNYHQIRSRLYGDLWFRDRFRVYAEMIDAHSFNQSLPPLAIDENSADFLNLFADVKIWDQGKAPVYARVGRQELLFGSQRLVSPLDWANTRRTFQGAKVFRVGEKWNADLFWMKPVIPNARSVDGWDVNQDFYGGWFTYKPKPGSTRDLYVLGARNRNQAADYHIATLGTRIAGDRDGTWLYDFEGAAQVGDQSGADFSAAAATVGFGYRAKQRTINPVLWVYYDYAGGTSDPAVTGRTHTFNQLFPFGHYYFGYLDLVGRRNIHDFNLQASINPMPFITMLFQYHHFALVSARDALFTAGGAVLRSDPTGASGKHVGDEFDLLANIHIARHHDLLFGLSYLVPGRFLRDAPGGTPVDPQFYYLQYSYKW